MKTINSIPQDAELKLTTPNGKVITITGELHHRLNAILTAYTQLLGVEGIKEVKRKLSEGKYQEDDVHLCYADLLYIIADLEQLFVDNGLVEEHEITDEEMKDATEFAEKLQ